MEFNVLYVGAVHLLYPGLVAAVAHPRDREPGRRHHDTHALRPLLPVQVPSTLPVLYRYPSCTVYNL